MFMVTLLAEPFSPQLLNLSKTSCKPAAVCSLSNATSYVQCCHNVVLSPSSFHTFAYINYYTVAIHSIETRRLFCGDSLRVSIFNLANCYQNIWIQHKYKISYTVDFNGVARQCFLTPYVPVRVQLLF